MRLEDVIRARKRAVRLLRKAHIVITPREEESLEVSDFGIGDLDNVGLLVVVYENNARYCAKEIILLPRQICPEHRHPPGREGPGKQETFRCRFGEVYLYVPGEPKPDRRAKVPEKYRNHLTVAHEVLLKPGDQYTLPPDTLHWFQSGDKGAVLSEFSSTSTDEDDIWTDPRLQRLPKID